MGFYVITDGKGSYIRHDEPTGRYVPIRSLKHAKQWDNILKAKAIFNNSLSANLRRDYEVRYVDTSETVEKLTLPQRQAQIDVRPPEDDNIRDWLEKINTIRDVLSGQTAREEELNGKLSAIDKEISDIHHYIEFGNYNACQGWRCFKILQTLLRQRRKYKNEIQVLTMIRSVGFNKASMDKLAENISEVQNKLYNPRAFPELFRGQNKNET